MKQRFLWPVAAAVLIWPMLIGGCQQQSQGPSLAERIKVAEAKKTQVEAQLDQLYKTFEVTNRQYQKLDSEHGMLTVTVTKAEQEYKDAQANPVSSGYQPSLSQAPQGSGPGGISINPSGLIDTAGDVSSLSIPAEELAKSIEWEKKGYIRKYELRLLDAKRNLKEWGDQNGAEYKRLETEVNQLRSKISNTNAELYNVQKELAELYQYRQAGYK